MRNIVATEGSNFDVSIKEKLVTLAEYVELLLESINLSHEVGLHFVWLSPRQVAVHSLHMWHMCHLFITADPFAQALVDDHNLEQRHVNARNVPQS